MIIRKNVRSLTFEERSDYIRAVLELKRIGRYDRYVHWHHEMMVPTVRPWEPQDPEYRNGAHLGPAFLPWHREMLMQFESDLRTVSPDVALPYWDWTEDADDPENSLIWSELWMGGNGDRGDHDRVQTGPFAHQYGNWPVPAYPENGETEPGLKRQFGVLVASLPTLVDVQMAMDEWLYDTPPYDSGPYTRGFRNRLEGWVTRRGDPQVTTAGSQLHNRVHLWIGGNMLAMTSPEDPVFFLHHCFIDKVWAEWQAQMALDNPQWAPHYAPVMEGPPGHNIDDTLAPWTRTVRQVLNIQDLGYEYSPVKQLHKRPFKSPFMTP